MRRIGPTTALLCLMSCRSLTEADLPSEPQVSEVAEWNGRLDGVITHADLDPVLLARWWTVLDDELLTSLIDRASSANLDLRTAGAQLREARAQRRIAESEAAPNAGANVGANRTSAGDTTTNLYSAAIDASWEFDLFGRIERGVEAAEADLQAAEEGRRDVLVTVLAEVALNYIELRTIQRRRELTEAELELQRESLNIARAKLDAGAAMELDVDRALSNLERTRAVLPALEQQIEQIENRLALLLGLAPGALDDELQSPRPLVPPSVTIALGVPAEVLRRRPDVRRAERQLAAETARVGVAIADLYPRFSLGGTIGLESDSTASLFDSASRIFSLGPRVQWTLFDGGRTRQRIEAQNARQEQALVQYERAILGALEDVENAVTAFAQERVRHRSLETAAEAASRAADVAEARYTAGEADFLTTLDAQRTRLSAQDELA